MNELMLQNAERLAAIELLAIENGYRRNVVKIPSTIIEGKYSLVAVWIDKDCNVKQELDMLKELKTK